MSVSGGIEVHAPRLITFSNAIIFGLWWNIRDGTRATAAKEAVVQIESFHLLTHKQGTNIHPFIRGDRSPDILQMILNSPLCYCGAVIHRIPFCQLFCGAAEFGEDSSSGCLDLQYFDTQSIRSSGGLHFILWNTSRSGEGIKKTWEVVKMRKTRTSKENKEASIKDEREREREREDGGKDCQGWEEKTLWLSEWSLNGFKQSRTHSRSSQVPKHFCQMSNRTSLVYNWVKRASHSERCDHKPERRFCGVLSLHAIKSVSQKTVCLLSERSFTWNVSNV